VKWISSLTSLKTSFLRPFTSDRAKSWAKHVFCTCNLKKSWIGLLSAVPVYGWSVFQPKTFRPKNFNLAQWKKAPLSTQSRPDWFVRAEPSRHISMLHSHKFSCLFMLSLHHCHTSAVTLLFPCYCGHISDKHSQHSSMTLGTICSGPQGWQSGTSKGGHSDSWTSTR